MRRLLAACRWEATLQARHQFYAVTAIVAFVWVAILRLLPAAARGDPALLVPLFVLTNLQITAFYFAAALMLLEKGQGVLAAFATSPLRAGEYVGTKALTLTLLGIAENATVVLLVFGAQPAWTWLLSGTALMSALYVCLGLTVVSPYSAINTFLVPSVGWIVAFSLPLIGYYGIVPWWTLVWHPLMPALTLLEAACRPLPAVWLIYGVLGSLAWCAAAFISARRRFAGVVAPAAV